MRDRARGESSPHIASLMRATAPSRPSLLQQHHPSRLNEPFGPAIPVGLDLALHVAVRKLSHAGHLPNSNDPAFVWLLQPIPNPDPVPRTYRGMTRPAMLRIKVLLPAPFGPSSPKHSPLCTSSVMPSRAVISPKRLTSVSTRKGGDDLATEVAGGDNVAISS